MPSYYWFWSSLRIQCTLCPYSHLTPVWSRPNDVGFLERNVAQRCIVALELVELQCAVIIGRTRYSDCTALHLYRQRRRYISTTTTTTTPEEFIITSFRDQRASETDGRRVIIPASLFNIPNTICEHNYPKVPVRFSTSILFFSRWKKTRRGRARRLPNRP